MLSNRTQKKGAMIVMMFIGLIIIATIVYFAFKNGNLQSSQQNSHSDNALDLLSQRYAKGEINEEEYTSKKRMLLNR